MAKYIITNGELRKVESDSELYHWKYKYKKKINGKWRYYYDDPKSNRPLSRPKKVGNGSMTVGIRNYSTSNRPLSRPKKVGNGTVTVKIRAAITKGKMFASRIGKKVASTYKKAKTKIIKGKRFVESMINGINNRPLSRPKKVGNGAVMAKKRKRR